MYPELLRIGDFVISSFGMMMVIAFLVGNYLLRRDMALFNQEATLADDLTFRAAIGGIVGAKLYYIVENLRSGEGLDNLKGLWDILAGIFTFSLDKITGGIHNFGAGMVFYGGFIGGLLAVTILVRKKKLYWKSVADWIAPYLVLGHGIGRIGCFLVGDDYGLPTALPWGIAFPNGVPPTIMPVHPTQLYEMTAYFLIFGYLFRKRRNKRFEGEIIYTYMILVGIARFLVEFIRTNPKYIFFSGAQWISLGMIIVGITLIAVQRKTGKVRG